LDVDEVMCKKAGYWGNSKLDLIPSRLELSRTLKNPTGKERRLAKAISQVEDQYDLVIVDCAPTESIITDSAYFASRYIIVPIKPEFMATMR
jgi:chromosome partitioning protein